LNGSAEKGALHVAQLVFDLTSENSFEKRIIQSSEPSAGPRRAGTLTATPHALFERHLVAAMICDLAQRLLGALLLLVGLGLTLTLWLLPLGLPLALLGCALIATPPKKIVSR
jgi:hypothetical protein